MLVFIDGPAQLAELRQKERDIERDRERDRQTDRQRWRDDKEVGRYIKP